jgi:hypothetical protein
LNGNQETNKPVHQAGLAGASLDKGISMKRNRVNHNLTDSGAAAQPEKKKNRPTHPLADLSGALAEASRLAREDEHVLDRLARWGITIKARTLLKTYGRAWCENLLAATVAKFHQSGKQKAVAFIRWAAAHPSEVTFARDDVDEIDEEEMQTIADCESLDEEFPGYGSLILREFYKSRELEGARR